MIIMYFDSIDVKNNFEKRLIKTDSCWTLVGYKNAKGYTKISINGIKVYGHRYSLAVKIGRDLLQNECACHTCDNPSCVNPDHLFVGSRKDNAHDAIKKGRFIFNERREYCKKGHILTKENIYSYKYGKYTHHTCKICKSLRDTSYKKHV